MIEQYRQGDVLFERVSNSTANLPKNGLALRDSGIILEGEISNHHHRATVGQVYLVKERQALEKELGEKVPENTHAYLVTEKPTEIVHEEHDTLKLGEGVWRIVRQRERTRTVAD